MKEAIIFGSEYKKISQNKKPQGIILGVLIGSTPGELSSTRGNTFVVRVPGGGS
jgi:hypothetical protein